MISINYENILLILILLFVMYYLFKWYIYTEGFGKIGKRNIKKRMAIDRARIEQANKLREIQRQKEEKFKRLRAEKAQRALLAKKKSGGFKAIMKKIKRTSTIPPPKLKSGGFKLGGFKSIAKAARKAAKDANNRAMMSTGYSMSNLGNTDYNYANLSKPVIDNIKSGIDQSNKLISNISRDTLSKTLGSFDSSKLSQLFPSNLISSIGNTFKISNSNTVENETAYDKQMEKDKIRLFGSQKKTNKKDNIPLSNQNVFNDQINNQVSRFNINSQ